MASVFCLIFWIVLEVMGTVDEASSSVSCHPSEILCDSGDQCVHWSSRCDYVAWIHGFVGFEQCSDLSDDAQCACGGQQSMFNGDSVNITSPNYPKFYSDSQECNWVFTASEEATFVITVHEMMVYGFGVDHFLLGRGPNVSLSISLFVIRTIPVGTVIAMEDKHVWMKLFTNSGQRQKGFLIQVDQVPKMELCGFEDELCSNGYTCIDGTFICTHTCSELLMQQNCTQCNNDDFWCASGNECVDETMRCDGMFQCLDGSDEIGCYMCKKPSWINMTTDETLYLTSPYYPDYYLPNMECLWLFTNLKEDAIYVIRYIAFSLRNEDYLSVGPTHEMLPNNTITQRDLYYAPVTLTVPHHLMWVHFESNHDTYTFPGFFIQIESTKETVSCNAWDFKCHSTDVCLDQYLVCNAFPDCIDASDEDGCDFCGQQNVVLAANEKWEIRTLPSFPYSYPNVTCQWFITASESRHIVMQFFLLFIDTNGDFLGIGHGHNVSFDTTVMNLTGVEPPNTLTINASKAWMLFKDPNANWWGFELFVFALDNPAPCGAGEFLCESGYGCLKEALVCDNHPQCLDGSDESACGKSEYVCLKEALVCDNHPQCLDVSDESAFELCGESVINLRPDETYQLTSPGYPNPYPINTDCSWHIYADTEDQFTTIVIQDTDLYEGLDFVYIVFMDHDSQVDLTGSTSRVPSSFIANGTRVMIRFVSYKWLFDHTGFAFNILLSPKNETCQLGEFACHDQSSALICLHGYQLCDGRFLCPDESDELDCGICGAKSLYLGSDSEVVDLPSPGYPIANYPNELSCLWTVTATNQRLIQIDIMEFNMEAGYDFLTVGNGKTSTPPSIVVSMTGLVKIRTITSQESDAWLQMTTDRSGVAPGFMLKLSRVIDQTDACRPIDFNCGQGICIDVSGKCDGFNDCLNFAEERHCAYVTCPTAYLCDEADKSNLTMCIAKTQVCDGKPDCYEGDDEISCDTKRCPDDCNCFYTSSQQLQIICNQGWRSHSLKDIPPISKTIHLTEGNMTTLVPGVFKSFRLLQSLSLSTNGIANIDPLSFDGLQTVSWMDLSYNPLQTLHRDTFAGLEALEELFLSEVPLQQITNQAFRGLPDLHTLILIRGASTENKLNFELDAFKGLSDLETLFVDDHRICCSFSSLEECTVLSPQPPLFNCGSLMQNTLLRVFMWILGGSSLFGNMFVIIWRFQEKKRNDVQRVQTLFIGNLALSDLIMGMYMLLLASVDVYYGNKYFIYSDEWRASNVCKFAGFICLLSSEASVFFLTAISADRLLGAGFPLSPVKFTPKIAKQTAVSIWIIAGALALAPVLLAGPDSDWYDLSDVCVGLPLITRPSSFKFKASGAEEQLAFNLPVATDSKPAWIFSIVIFLGINLVCFFAMLICYVIVFIQVKKSRRQAGRSGALDEEIKLVISVMVIVATDFLCWVPVIIMGILSQTGAVVIPLDAYIWSVVFILPVNSSINPYLYTMISLITTLKKKFPGRKNESQQIGSSKGTESSVM